MKLVKFFIVGIVFGIVLTKAEAVSWYRIYEMFMFQSFHMYGIIVTAIFVGVTGIYLIKKKEIQGKLLNILIFTISDGEKAMKHHFISILRLKAGLRELERINKEL